VNTKTCLIGFPSTQNKCSKVLVDISLKVLLQKRDMGYAKVIHKKREKRELRKKMDKCLRYLKQWVLRYPSEKRKR